MPYTFGAGTGDDITFTSGGLGGNAAIGLVTGWWRPTTLTATRGLWSSGNIVGAEIDTTTDELRLRTDNTTDGQWTTTGVDLVVDEWRFLAFLLSCSNTGPTAIWRVWAGSVESAPQSVTVTNAVAPVGNFVSPTAVFIGNKGTATQAFQGDISDVTFVVSASGASSPQTHPFGINAFNALSTAEEQYIYETMVLPLWLGNIDQMLVKPGNSLNVWHCGLDWGAAVVGNGRAAATTIQPNNPTINGATWSQNGAPRPGTPGPDMLPFKRRP